MKPQIPQIFRGADHAAWMGEYRAAFNVFEGKSKETEQGTQRREGNNRIDLTERGCNNINDWPEIAQDKNKWWSLVNAMWASEQKIIVINLKCKIVKY